MMIPFIFGKLLIIPILFGKLLIIPIIIGKLLNVLFLLENNEIQILPCLSRFC